MRYEAIVLFYAVLPSFTLTGNNKLPEAIPIELVEHKLPFDEQNCSECNGALHIIGYTKRQESKIVPAKAMIVEHVRKEYACRNCEKDELGVPIWKAPVDDSVTFIPQTSRRPKITANKKVAGKQNTTSTKSSIIKM